MAASPPVRLGDLRFPLYDRLNVSVSATDNELKSAYKRLAKRCHPDRNPGNSSATENFQALLHAYEVLMDPMSREQHDLHFGCLNELSCEEYLERYFYLLFSPQGLSLRVLRSSHVPEVVPPAGGEE